MAHSCSRQRLRIQDLLSTSRDPVLVLHYLAYKEPHYDHKHSRLIEGRVCLSCACKHGFCHYLPFMILEL